HPRPPLFPYTTLFRSEAAHVVQRAQQIALAGWVVGALQAPGDLAVCGEHGIEQAAILLREPVIVPVQVLAEVVDEDAERGLLPRGQGGFGQVEGLVLAIGRRRTEVAAVGPDLEERGLLTMRGLPGPPVGLQSDLPLLARHEGGAVPDT